MKQSTRALIPLALFLALAALLFYGLQLDPRKVPSPLVGKPAPEFALPNLFDPAQTVRLADLKGAPFVMNVWGSWCVACREEHPTLTAFAESKRVRVIGYNWKDEPEEAKRITDKLETLRAVGHEDVEGGILWESCAVLGRTRFALMAVEAELRERGIPFYKHLTANHENESDVMEDFGLALRVMANPKDKLHLSALANRWKTSLPRFTGVPEAVDMIAAMAAAAGTRRAKAIADALAAIAAQTQRLDLIPGINVISGYADSLEEDEKRAVYEDAAVFGQEWDQYLRSGPSNRSIGGFMSSKALGATQQAAREGVALLTVHSSKGLEFDVVFVAGMAEGVFPDYRALGKSKALAEEARNAFVAFTRSKRLLYLSYPRQRKMPWGGTRLQKPSRYLNCVTQSTGSASWSKPLSSVMYA